VRNKPESYSGWRVSQRSFRARKGTAVSSP
jgi:hypothetical protein